MHRGALQGVPRVPVSSTEQATRLAIYAPPRRAFAAEAILLQMHSGAN